MGFRNSMARRFGDTLGSGSTQYLSYYDICLTTEDVRSLRNDWLTDNNIAFWEEWLEREVLIKYPEAKIVLLRPSMTFLMMQSSDVRSIASALPNFDKITHIFLPVNDARDSTRSDLGSHWSLLLVSKIDGVAFHYDSLGGANYYEAQKCTDRLSKVLGQALRFYQMNDCPQQENSSDCGVYVCILMRHLLIKKLLNANATEKVSMSMAGKAVDSRSGRKEMMNIIESLRKEGERRRSASPFPSSSTPPRID
ncbi:uncharacterized protein PODANS_1_6170 [Podospora anserina S mat+]|uniref:Podospora anserina S mat+ genomic DNA chromosome 1, supercontig 1 n=2 Tax=Podospora TaxID=5144 RepID=B2AB54_PODAN|nr:uncharacterized protein PODANS_1_6170 [Podospora anserina S mat+]CAP60316.1 unnamed protein product [Podospora anserina S mat+]CDP22954.1 Putative protease [Podospora anserina S mat+]VBB72020.1 Putative protease [Podospora comata]